MNPIVIDNRLSVGPGQPLALVAGPCVIESADHLLRVGQAIAEAAEIRGIPFILKSSFDKANRTSADSYRGPGLEVGLRILAGVREELDVPLLCDVHLPEQVPAVAEVADVLQIPAFLCRQTDLLLAAADSGKPVNLKKGQFLAPDDMAGAIGKITSRGNQQIILTERGSSFGYHNLVVDMRSLVIMRQLGYPVMFDATHSLQLPGGLGHATGGQREFIPQMARAAAAIGIDLLFMEVHDDPDQAPCDGPNMLPLSELGGVLDQVQAVSDMAREQRWMS